MGTAMETQEGSKKEMKSITQAIIKLLLVVFSLLYIYTSGFGVLSSESHRGVYLLFTMVLCFLIFPFKRGAQKSNPVWIDWVLAGVAILLGAYSPLIVLVLFYFANEFWYIPFEEKAMLNKFGDKYIIYKSHTRRWI